MDHPILLVPQLDAWSSHSECPSLTRLHPGWRLHLLDTSQKIQNEKRPSQNRPVLGQCCTFKGQIQVVFYSLKPAFTCVWAHMFWVSSPGPAAYFYAKAVPMSACRNRRKPIGAGRKAMCGREAAIYYRLIYCGARTCSDVGLIYSRSCYGMFRYLSLKVYALKDLVNRLRLPSVQWKLLWGAPRCT